MDRAFHPVAAALPKLPGNEFEALKESIRRKGLLQPIFVLPDDDGRIIDGCHRWRACQELGIDPRTEVYTGDTSLRALIDFVTAMNLERRHLSESQRSMAAARMVEMIKVSDDERIERGREGTRRYHAASRTRDATSPPIGGNVGASAKPEHSAPHADEYAAKKWKVGTASVSRAQRVIRQGAPELIAAVDEAVVPTTAACALSYLPHDEQRAALAGSKEQLRLAARLGDRIRKEQVRTMRTAKARSEARQKSSSNGQPQIAAAEELRTDFMSSDTIDALERLLSVRWTPEEAVAKFDPRQIQSLERVRERATAWLVEFNALWEARCGAEDERRAG